jgi:hypothetical protein
MTLIECIGEEAMQRLVGCFGGTTIYVPSRVPDEARDSRVREAFVQHVQDGGTFMQSYAAVASEVGLTVRRVQQIVATEYETF